MRRIVIKEGPLVFLRNVLVMEIIAALFLYAISFLENYEKLYESFEINKVFRYDIFLIIAFSSFQLIYVTLLFLDWYFSYFEITPKEITKKSGLIFRHKKSVNLSHINSVETYESPASRIMHHYTIILHYENNRVIKIKNVANADGYVHIIKQLINDLSKPDLTQNIALLIKKGEGFLLEFKETLRVDIRKKEVSKEVERAVMKTLVGFLNAEGGTLLIGVRDDSSVVGLTSDYQTLPKKNRDGFANHLNQLVRSMIGLPFSKYIDIQFEKINDMEVCVISVSESHKPSYLKTSDQKEEFFVRVGNSTQPFSMSETEEYITTKWK